MAGRENFGGKPEKYYGASFSIFWATANTNAAFFMKIKKIIIIIIVIDKRIKSKPHGHMLNFFDSDQPVRPEPDISPVK